MYISKRKRAQTTVPAKADAPIKEQSVRASEPERDGAVPEPFFADYISAESSAELISTAEPIENAESEPSSEARNGSTGALGARGRGYERNGREKR